MSKRLDLKDIVLIGRTFDEYYNMFELSSLNKTEKILDVASGVSSFCSEARALGYDVTASDRIYCFSSEELEEKCTKDLEVTMEKMIEVKDLFKWKFFKDIEDLRKHRKKAYLEFARDYKEKGSECYINTAYPISNFKDKQFDISLVSHFLFLYDEFLDYEFHKQVIKELTRIVSKEIRIFPLVNLKGEKSSFVRKLMSDKEFIANKIEVKNVGYEFLSGADEMLVIKIE